LALQVAREVAGEFSDGVCLVEMAPLADPGLVPSTVVQALGIELNHASADAIARAIGDQQLLLILDNCEHVISEASSLAESLVRTGSRITILATSRESLRVSGERVYRVPPLGVPAAEGFNALQILDHGGPELFVTRAKELGADFAWQATDLLMIADICRHLDGMPLAIEFAAARAATLGIAEVAGGLRDRFALLTSGRRTALPRHRTLHATLDWSYRLLSAAERGLLDRLAIFSGPFSIDGATAVASDNVSRGEAAPLVANLVDKSMRRACEQAVHYNVLGHPIAALEAATTRRDRWNSTFEVTLPDRPLAPVGHASLALTTPTTPTTLLPGWVSCCRECPASTGRAQTASYPARR
jgi:predicted ATPase